MEDGRHIQTHVLELINALSLVSFNEYLSTSEWVLPIARGIYPFDSIFFCDLSERTFPTIVPIKIERFILIVEKNVHISYIIWYIYIIYIYV